MPAQEYPILEIDATFPQEGQQTGVFEFRKADVVEKIRTGPLVENGFSQVLGAISEVVEGVELDGISVNNGAGQRVWEIDIEGQFSTETETDGQWGASDDPTELSHVTATGGDRVQKAQVLLNFIETASTDSFSPARLIYGGFAPGGIMPSDHVDVYIEDPLARITRSDSSTFPSELTLVRTTDLSDPVSATQRTG
jgi:hypothetical protein